MWGRFKRIVRANLGRLSELGAGGSNLGDGLEREARDLQKQVAELDKSLLTFKGELTFLEEKARKLARREEELDAVVRAADGRGSLAASSYGLELERVRTERVTVQRQLETCRAALERAQEMKRAFTSDRDKRVAEAQERERAMLELQREDMQAELRPATASASQGSSDMADEDAVRRWEAEQLRAPAAKTLGADPVAPPISVKPADGAPAHARSTKTIGPVPGEEAPVAALKIKVKPTKTMESDDARPAAPAVTLTTESRPAPVAVRPDPGSAPTPAPGTDLVVELERLARLREQGVLTAEELEQAKRRLLGSAS